MLSRVARGLSILDSYGSSDIQSKSDRIVVNPTSLEMPTADVDTLRALGWNQVDASGMEETCYNKTLYWEYS